MRWIDSSVVDSFRNHLAFFERKILWIASVLSKNALNTQILEHLDRDIYSGEGIEGTVQLDQNNLS